jgi:hypothetical protein
MSLPASCLNGDAPCTRGTHAYDAITWMILVPSCFSVSVILVCMGIVACTVLQQRGVVREQQRRLTHLTAPPSEANLTPSAHLSVELRVGTSPSTRDVSAPPLSGRSLPVSESMRKLPSNAPSIDRLTNEAIVQCILSGCSFVNSVTWTNASFCLNMAGKASRGATDLYWVCKVASVTALSQECHHLTIFIFC